MKKPMADGFLEKSEVSGRMLERFSQLDSNADGKVSQDEALAAPVRPGVRAASRKPGEVVAPAALEERRPEQLKAGEMAPDFTLPLANSPGKVSLSELWRNKPVVLVFGSISCSPFRKQVEDVEKLYGQYREKANFLMVYIREAHPDSVILVKTEKGDESLQKFVQTDDAKLRDEHARTCQRTLNLSFPTAVDQVDNKVSMAYAGWPIRLVIIGTDGKIIDPGAPGPRGFDPGKVSRWLAQFAANN